MCVCLLVYLCILVEVVNEFAPTVSAHKYRAHAYIHKHLYGMYTARGKY